MSCIRFDVPVKAPSLTNQREHHHARHARTDRQRGATRRAWPGYEGGPLLVVRLTRVAPRRLDDDNVRGALKSVRDEVAALLRVDDATPLLRWEYGQEKGAEDCVRVEVAWGTAPAALLGQVLHLLTTQAETTLRAAPSALPPPAPVWEALDFAPDASHAMAGPPGASASISEAPRLLPPRGALATVESDARARPLTVARPDGTGSRRAPADLRSLATPNHTNHRRKP